MSSKTTAMTALLVALSLSPLGVKAEGDITTLPLKPACADSQTSVWCAAASDDSGIAEVRHPLTPVLGQGEGRDYFYATESGEGCDLCFDN